MAGENGKQSTVRVSHRIRRAVAVEAAKNDETSADIVEQAVDLLLYIRQQGVSADAVREFVEQEGKRIAGAKASAKAGAK